MGFKSRKKQNLVQGVFNTPEKVLQDFVRRRDERKWDISDEVIYGLSDNMHLVKELLKDPVVDGVLIRALIPPPDGSSMGTLQYTFEEFWSWVSDTQQGNVFRHPGIKTDSEHLSFLDNYYGLESGQHGLESGQVHGLESGQAQWSTIEFNGKKYRHLKKKPRFSAGLELLAAAAQYPQRVLAMDGKDNPYWNLAGLNLFMPDVNTCPERCSPTLSVLKGRVSLLYNDTSAPYHSPGGWASPEIIDIW